ncbi:hypothetical protein BX666DRAFT_2022878 [Dichotomocladium elegans]|nr:hypothetical protein BX666DRAFT_2022878 [Dichotomocladium elegans]
MNITEGHSQPPPLPPRTSTTTAALHPEQEFRSPSQYSKANEPHSTSAEPRRIMLEEEEEEEEDQQQSKTPSRPRAASCTRNDNADSIAAHYAFLQRHVRGVKRTRVPGLKSPEFKDFIVQSNDDSHSSEIRWREFFQAWLEYIIQSLASGQVDDDLEPFSLKTVKSGVDRLYRLALPLQGPAIRVRRLYRWENRWATGLLAMCYLSLWYYDLIVPFLFLAIIGYCVHVRIDMMAQFSVEALATVDPGKFDNSVGADEDVDAGGHAHQFWRRLRQDLGRNTVYPVQDITLFEKRSLSDWWAEIKRMYGPKGQLILLDTVDRLERVKNLVTWKRPAETRKLLCLLSITTLFFAALPSRYISKLFFLYLGFEFFVLQALRSHYPRHRRLFNIIDCILWGVPNDAEYAMDVIRLHRSTADMAPPESSTQGARKPVPGHLTEEDTLQPSAPGIISRPPAAEPGAGEDKRATSSSAAATLAMMVAGAAIGQAKMAIDEKLHRAHGTFSEEEGSSQRSSAGGTSSAVRPAFSAKDLLERKSSQGVLKDADGEVVATYGCVYKGSIPGRLVLTEKGLQFRASRVTGARVLVYYYWADIVSVRKTKSIDLVVWHTNGLSIKTVDGEELLFENVIKRDDCFNRLVAIAGDQWR